MLRWPSIMNVSFFQQPIAVSSASSIHIPLLHVVDARFTRIVGLLLLDAGLGDRLSLSVECRSSMLLCRL
jgi:hypothetical protein